MKLVVGLGNPGPEYARTRHNVGFWVVDRVAERRGLPLAERAYRSAVARGSVAGEPYVLIEPQTFMNRSGAAVRSAADDLGVAPDRILVAYDDLDLPVGKLRLRSAGGAGGHRGVASITEALGTKEFPRLRVGIGRPERGGDVVEWVLEPPSASESEALASAVETAAEAVECWLAEGLPSAMNRYNPPASRASETGRG